VWRLADRAPERAGARLRSRSARSCDPRDREGRPAAAVEGIEEPLVDLGESLEPVEDVGLDAVVLDQLEQQLTDRTLAEPVQPPRQPAKAQIVSQSLRAAGRTGIIRASIYFLVRSESACRSVGGFGISMILLWASALHSAGLWPVSSAC
jgi:hypothetical protein